MQRDVSATLKCIFWCISNLPGCSSAKCRTQTCARSGPAPPRQDLGSSAQQGWARFRPAVVRKPWQIYNTHVLHRKGLLCNVLPCTYISWDHPDDLRKNIRTNQQTTRGTLFPGSANPSLLFTAPESLTQRLQLLSTAEKPSSNNIFTAT